MKVNGNLAIHQGSVSMNQGSISIDQGSFTVSSTITSSSTIKGTKYLCAYGKTIAYNYNWNSTGLSGWFIG